MGIWPACYTGFAQTWKSPWIWPWSWKTGIWKKCLLSWNFVKSSLVLEKYKIQQVLSDLWDAPKKTVWKWQKTEWKSLDTHQRARWDLYSILFNLCGSPRFYHRNQNQRKRVRLFTLMFPAIKSAFFALFYTMLGRNWVLEKWKKVLEFSFPISVRTLL